MIHKCDHTASDVSTLQFQVAFQLCQRTRNSGCWSIVMKKQEERVLLLISNIRMYIHIIIHNCYCCMFRHSSLFTRPHFLTRPHPAFHCLQLCMGRTLKPGIMYPFQSHYSLYCLCTQQDSRIMIFFLTFSALVKSILNDGHQKLQLFKLVHFYRSHLQFLNKNFFTPFEN